MRRPVLIALTLSALVVPSSAADAATPRCQGHRATIVGHAGQQTLSGTKYRDVIVSNGAGVVRAGRGDDLVCVTGSTGRVYDETGDDVIDARHGRLEYVFLGDGDDTYLGSDAVDDVFVDRGGRDLVMTGKGDDRVEVDHTSALSIVDLGPGRDDLTVFERHPFRIVGGPGSDLLSTRDTGGHQYDFDNRVGRLWVDGRRWLSWDSIERFDFASVTDGSSLSFTGSAHAEWLALTYYIGEDEPGDDDPPPGLLAVDLNLGQGNDHLTLKGNEDGRIDLGSGRDRLRYERPVADSVYADLAESTIETTGDFLPGDPDRQLLVAGIEDIFAQHLSQVILTGDAIDNAFTVEACPGTSVIHGGAGDDTLDADAARYCAPSPSPAFSLFGDDGDDHLDGTVLDDLLDGGPGDDEAMGGQGEDTCYAETRTGCERP